ncbi:hypothetical protein CHS0354_020562, partial [Potamilus streckersoni]
MFGTKIAQEQIGSYFSIGEWACGDKSEANTNPLEKSGLPTLRSSSSVKKHPVVIYMGIRQYEEPILAR